MLIKRIGFVDTVKAWNWVQGLDLVPDSWNGKDSSSGRMCKWYGIGVSLGFDSKKFQAEEIPRGLRIRGNELVGHDRWNSVLILKYSEGVELKPHTDRTCFDDEVVIINLCRNLLGESEFIYGVEEFKLRDGEVLKINSRIPHGVKRVIGERFSISFRTVL